MIFDVCIVNLNCLNHTKNLVEDLNRQQRIHPLQISVSLYDQASDEVGTDQFLNYCDKQLDYNVHLYNEVVSLHSIWNSFVAKSQASVVCLLNNDIRIPWNFFSDLDNIFELNLSIGAIMHPTNHPSYAQIKESTEYIKLPSFKYRQGWDICMRREAWTPIPRQLHAYCGDDFIFEEMYRKEYTAVIATSSPIIHYLGQTKKNTPNIKGRNPPKDIEQYKSMGYSHYLTHPEDYTILDYNHSPVKFIKE